MSDIDIKWSVEDQARQCAAIGIVPVLETFVLRNGHLGTPCRRPHGFAKMKDKECFHNATHHLLEHGDRGWKYVEGFACRQGLGMLIHHAWVEDAEGNVRDLTWRLPEACRYYGVSFEIPVMWKQIEKQDYYGLLANPVAYNFDFMCEVDPGFREVIESAVEEAKAKRAAFRAAAENAA